MAESLNKALFISYASQDAAPALRICEALRTAGVEVWFDQSELVGGDSWDQKIRAQIRDCALFMPVMSKTTQVRREAYFRLEWRLADERTFMMAKGTPFLLPVTIDETNDREAIVPDSFLQVQWTKLPGGETPPTFAERVKKLLNPPDPSAAPRQASSPAYPIKPWAKSGRIWTVCATLGAAALIALALWLSRKPSTGGAESPVVPMASAPAATVSEARQLASRARDLFETLDATRDDFDQAEGLLKQAEAKDQTDAEVWAAASSLDNLYSVRGWDHSDIRRDAARSEAQHALRLDPKSFEVRFSQANLLGNTGREGDQKKQLLQQLLRERPKDKRVLRALAAVIDRLGDVDGAAALLSESAALPGGDPLALYDRSLNYWFVGRTTEAEANMRETLAQSPFAGALLMEAWFQTVLHGDLAGAKATLDRIPISTLQDDRGAYFAFYVDYLRRDVDGALERLKAMPREWIQDAWHRGPKDLLVGDALNLAGRREAAVVAWRAGLKLVDERLTATPNNSNLMLNRVVLLARLGLKEDAEHQFVVVTQANSVNPDGTASVIAPVTTACVALGHYPEAIRQVSIGLKQQRHAVDFTASVLKLDPVWDPLRNDPKFKAVVAEAEAAERNEVVRSPVGK